MEADAVSTPYSYDTCLSRIHYANTGITSCREYGTMSVDSVPLVPPFTYNYQCGSVLLTSFIPVLIMGYSIQLLLPVAAMAILTYVPYSLIPLVCRHMFRGILWPTQWSQGGTELVHNKLFVNKHTDVMLQIRSILCNDVLNNWILMLTFGLCSPILAVAIVCCVLVKMTLWMILIGRFTRHVLVGNGDSDGDSAVKAPVPRVSTIIVDTSNDEVIYFALESLTQVRISLFNALKYSFWRLAWCSALFVGLLSWDLAGDEVGWLQSLWVPLLPLFHMLMLHCIAYYFSCEIGDGMAKGVSVEEKNVALPGQGVDFASRNPLHHEDSSAL